MKRSILAMLAMLCVVSTVLICHAQETAAPEAPPEAAAEGTEPQQKGGMTFWETNVAGGWIMIPIYGGSVVMIALAVEYLVKNKRSRLFPKERIDSILTELKKGRFDEARNLCQDTQVFICRVLSPGLEKVKARTEAIETAIAESIERESSVLHTRNGYFSVLATIEPMMGLLGTVLGMIAAFNVIAFQAGLGKPALLAQGVSQALITTAAGLIVAIPAMICFFLFRMDISKKLETAMEIATEAVETIKTVKESGPIEDKPAEEAVPGEPQGETQS